MTVMTYGYFLAVVAQEAGVGGGGGGGVHVMDSQTRPFLNYQLTITDLRAVNFHF